MKKRAVYMKIGGGMRRGHGEGENEERRAKGEEEREHARQWGIDSRNRAADRKRHISV